jgi:hypothetical protein
MRSAPCDHCKTPIQYHGERPVGLFLCSSCQHTFHDPGCHICGDASVMTVEDTANDGSGYRGDIALCQRHYEERRLAS